MAVAEPEPLGRGGGLRFSAAQREESGPVLAMNGDELLDVDYGALLAHHRAHGPAATVVVAQVRSPFGVVDVGEDELRHRLQRSAEAAAVGRTPVSTFSTRRRWRPCRSGRPRDVDVPGAAERERLLAYRHEGAWLTVNTPKDLRRAEEWIAAHPDGVRRPSRKPRPGSD